MGWVSSAIVLIASILVYNVIIYPFVIDVPYPCTLNVKNDKSLKDNLSCYFSDSYQTARYRFRLLTGSNEKVEQSKEDESANDQARKLQRKIEHYAFTVIDDLTIDFALIRGASDKLIIHISGTHGPEVS